MSGAADVASKSRTTSNDLSRYGFKPHQKQVADTKNQLGPPFSSSTSSPISSGPPTQSRDATHSSRYFPSTPSSGHVLVPNSSPLTHENGYRSYTQNQHPQVPIPFSGLNHLNSRTQDVRSYVDPLSRSSGFVASTEVNNASLTRSLALQGRPLTIDDGGSDSERPRKRAHLSKSDFSDPLNLFGPESPPSPEVLRPGQRRQPLPSKMTDPSTSISSEGSLSGQTNRVARSPSKPLSGRGESSIPEALKTFRVVNAWIDQVKVDAAFYKANGDISLATNFVLDPDFHPRTQASPPSSSSTPISAPLPTRIVGKVKEVEEEREAKRAHQRDIASKSHIYRRRSAIDASSPSSSSVSLAPVITEPDSSPIRQPLIRLKQRRAVIESESEDGGDSDSLEDDFERRTLDSFNKFESDALRELTGCSLEQAEKIISLRPFGSVEDLNKRLCQDKKKAGPAGISPRMFQDTVDIYRGYGDVDRVLKDCELIGKELRNAIKKWSGEVKGKGKERENSTFRDDLSDDGALHLVSIPQASATGGYISEPPSLLAPGVQLKDYQLTGINWLKLLHSKKYSCILADEMGLGKTVQVISFFAQLKEENCPGPHLVVVPSSTLENWTREFEKFAPSISIQTYYGQQKERPIMREELLASMPGRKSKKYKPWEVLITTYNLAVGDQDRKFFRKIPWNTCVFDEGHVLKNFQSQRYNVLTKIGAEWKLLLTGTPLQNNLQELVSVMNFILPDKFGDEETQQALRAIFKVKGDSKQLLAEERVKRAKKMMTPFVLRRRKDQVLKDLPKKIERIEWCSLSPIQKSIYDDARMRSRKTIMDETQDAAENTDGAKNGAAKKGRSTQRGKEKKYIENSSNVLMDLRKAASHPMLFRTQFTDATLSAVTKVLLKEPDFKRRGALFEIVKEDMEVMTDSELQEFCRTYKSTQKFLLKEDSYVDTGKVKKMLELLELYMSENRKVLIFSQFTQILDILQVILKQRSIKHLVLTGSTAVDVRQGLVDEFTEDETIPVFLLSTKAGGMGINLTAASVVILFDQDFNPHNDKQAADRAYRIGQKRDVDIVKLISRGTIEEDMLKLGQTKLALDEAVAGDAEEGGEGKAEKIMRSGLMSSLRKQFEEEDKVGPEASGTAKTLVSNKAKENKKEKDAKKQGGKKGEATGTEGFDSDSSELTDLEGS